jgi:DNA-directed RNA polymerase specialized sigma24 family protein
MLRPVLGEDTELVLSVLVLDEFQTEAAVRLGIMPGTARKRFQRALDRLRSYLGGR